MALEVEAEAPASGEVEKGGRPRRERPRPARRCSPTCMCRGLQRHQGKGFTDVRHGQAMGKVSWSTSRVFYRRWQWKRGNIDGNGGTSRGFPGFWESTAQGHRRA
ncbi:unnamed protein product [Victoria cruziana]